MRERLPQPVFRKWRRNAYFLLADRMHETHEATEKRDASIRIGALRSILQVSLDGASYFRELATYLMMASSLQFHLNETVMV